MHFAPHKLGEMIHPDLVIKKFTSFLFVFATSSNVHWTQLTLSLIHDPQN